MTMKTETNKRTFKGKPAIEKLLKFEEHIEKKSIVTQPETRLRASLLPKNGKSVSPIECFQSLVDKHDNKSVQNIYFMCLSFILQAAETTEAAPAEGAAPAAEQAQEEEEVDIDLSDPKVQDATVKIQAGFKVPNTRDKIEPLHSIVMYQLE